MKKYRAILLTVFLLGGVLGCTGETEAKPQDQTAVSADAPESAAAGGGNDETAGEEAAGEISASSEENPEPVTFSMYFVDPDSSPYVQGGCRISELVSEATEGRIRIDVVGSSEMGERELVEGAMDNTVDIATCANSVLTNYIPQMNILDQAYLWENADEAHAAVDGALGELIAERALTLGLHVLGFEESGFRNTFSTKPIDSIEDFAGITIRTMENKYHQAAFKAFGAEPVAMPYPEVLDALKNGEINACENATVNCLNSGYYVITKHVTDTQHAFTYILLLMSDEAWERIPENLREPFMEAVRQGVEWERDELVRANDSVAEELKKLGVEFHDIDTSVLKEAYRNIAEEKGFTFDPEWVSAVDDAVREAASMNSGSSDAA